MVHCENKLMLEDCASEASVNQTFIFKSFFIGGFVSYKTFIYTICILYNILKILMLLVAGKMLRWHKSDLYKRIN